MVQQLFNDVEILRQEIKRLRGRLDSISVGNKIVPGSVPGTANVPPAVAGFIIVGNATPAWERQRMLGFSAAHAEITAAGTTIVVTRTIMTLTANADYTLTSAPTIANGADGQLVVLVNADASNIITFQDQGTLASSNLRLAANQIALAPRDSLALLYSTALGDWVQIGFMDVL